jgi:hypothetical protein
VTVEDPIKALQEYPHDMEVECVSDFSDAPYVDDDGDIVDITEEVWEPISSVEMYNRSGNVVRVK